MEDEQLALRPYQQSVDNISQTNCQTISQLPLLDTGMCMVAVQPHMLSLTPASIEDNVEPSDRVFKHRAVKIAFTLNKTWSRIKMRERLEEIAERACDYTL